MRKIHLVLFLLFALKTASAQSTQSPSFDNRLKELLDFSIPTIDVTKASENSAEYVFLDARELEEYQVSHIPGARYVGYNHFSPKYLKGIDYDQNIIIYCSVGYRSEKLGEKLSRMGYKNVNNLYGSIFEWVNCGLPVENGQGVTTDSIHTYNSRWSKWVSNSEMNKIW